MVVSIGFLLQVYGSTLEWLQRETSCSENVSIPIAAGAAGVVLSGVLGPAELVKCRMQVAGSNGHAHYSGYGLSRLPLSPL